jgi:uncharacterized membrane protein
VEQVVGTDYEVRKLALSIKNEFIYLFWIGLVLLALIAAGAQGLPAPLPLLRLLLGLGYVLLVPGYALQAALFPRADDLDGPERLALSFGLSVAVVPPLALVLDALPWGIRLWPIVIIEALFTLACSVVALYRRQRLAEEERPVLAVEFDPRVWWAEQDRTQRLLWGGLALALCMAAVAATAIIVSPKPGEKLTEFYILGPEGLAQDYPREVFAGQTVTVTMGIANHEAVPAEYRMEIRDGTGLISQAGPIRLEAGQTDERTVSFAPVELGDDVKVEFLLYRDGGADPYRSLRLWIKVKEEEAEP